MKRLTLLLLFILMAIPGYAGITVIGGLTRERNVKTGEKVEGIILLKNTGEEICEVKVYQTEYLFYSDGRNDYGKPGNNPRSNIPWVVVKPLRLTIPSQETASVYYTISIPDDKSLQGTYWSLIMVEPIPGAAPEVTPEKEKVSVGIQTLIRYAIQIITNIEDTGERKIKFLDKTLLEKDGETLLQIDIENIGTRGISPQVWIELYNSQGIYTGRFEGTKLRIYPTCSVRQKIELTGVPKGKYKGLLVVDNGDEHVFGAQYDLEIK